MQYEDKLLDHNYDGIQELDNKLPPWWLNLFYITIIWGVAYFFYFHVFEIGNSQIDSYNEEMGISTEQSGPLGLKDYKSPFADKGGAQQPVQQPQQPQPGDEAAAAAPVTTEPAAPEVHYDLITDPARLQNGEKVFKTNCFPCHGMNGEGGIGPNLTDNYWINGDGSFSKIVSIIQNGVPVKGMISWKPILSEKDILDVASHVYKLRGTNPPNAKAPQGEKYGD